MTWGGGSGNWQTGNSYWGTSLPGVNDTAILKGGSATLSFDTGVATFQQSGGTLTGAGTLSAADLIWTGGTMSGGGITTVTGNATLGSAASTQELTLGTYYYSGRTLNLQGATSFDNGSNALYLYANSAINNSGTFTSNNAKTASRIYGSGKFNNSGTYVQDSATQKTTISDVFDNKGSVTAKSGTLSLASGNSSGAWNAQDSGTIEFASGTYNFNAGTTFSTRDAGRILFNGASLNIAGGTTVSSTGTVHLTGGYVTGAGTLSVADLIWTGGTMSGGGITTVTGNATLGSAASTQELTLGTQYSAASAPTLKLQGATSFDNGSNALHLYSGSVINNSGTFTSNNTKTASRIYGSGKFNNSGTYVQDSATQKTTISDVFDNKGSVTAKTGTLSLAWGNSSGAWNAQDSGTIEFASGTYNFNAGTTFSTRDAGRILFNGASLNIESGTTVSSTGTLYLTGGYVTGAGTLSTADLIWNGGTMSGRGVTTVTGNATLGSAASTQELTLGTYYSAASAPTLKLQGATSFDNGSNALYLYFGSVINNSGTFTSNNAKTASRIYGSGKFNNSGTYVQDSATQKTTISDVFDNKGSVTAKTGTLSLASGNSSGAWNAQDSGTIEFASGTYNFNAGTTFSTRDAGRILFNGASLNIGSGTTVNSTGTLYLTGGYVTGAGTLSVADLIWTGGTMYGGSITTVTGNATLGSAASTQELTLGTYYSAASAPTLNLQGATSFDNGSNALYLYSGSVINNSGTFTSNNAKTASRIYGGGQFKNSGTYVQDSGTRTTSIATAFTNTGTVRVASGTLQLDSLQNYSTATQTLTGGNYQVGSGTLAIAMGSGRSIANNAASISFDGTTAAIRNSNGNTDGLAALSINSGKLSLTNGAKFSSRSSFANTGSVTVGSGSALTVGAGGAYTQSAGSSMIDGTLTAANVNIQSGTLGGSGTISGNVVDLGLLSPGNSLGQLSISGNFQQSSTSSLLIEIAGDRQGVDYDWLSVGGGATLGGTLGVVFANGFTPHAGETFSVLSYASNNGTRFDTISVTGLGQQYKLETTYSSNGLSLTVAAVPEPETYAMLLAGLSLVGLAGSRKKYQRS